MFGVHYLFAGFRDDDVHEDLIAEYLERFKDCKIFAPLPEDGGNEQHNLIGRLASRYNPTYYGTCTKNRPFPTGDFRVELTYDELKKKNVILDCYASQFKMDKYNSPYFNIMQTGPEYISYEY